MGHHVRTAHMKLPSQQQQQQQQQQTESMDVEEVDVNVQMLQQQQQDQQQQYQHEQQQQQVSSMNVELLQQQQDQQQLDDINTQLLQQRQSGLLQYQPQQQTGSGGETGTSEVEVQVEDEQTGTSHIVEQAMAAAVGKSVLEGSSEEEGRQLEDQQPSALHASLLTNFAEASMAELAATGEAGTSESPLTKELFLCGQCSLGFGSIEECKTHMVQDHNNFHASVPGSSGSQTSETGVGTNRVDASTQVQRKKPGRKKKAPEAYTASMVKEEPKSERDLESDEENEEEEDDDDEAPRRRRIRPPRMLEHDYVMYKRPRATLSQEERRELTKGYDITCSESGCNARFKTEVAQQVHESCHMGGEEEGSSVYRCCVENCQVKYSMWKAMRKHLWKEHKVDTDLYTCGQCGYKVESLSKLANHKEIHGRDRPYCCDICGKAFKQERQMKNHRTIHMSDSKDGNDKWYMKRKCEECGHILANMKCLKKHMETVHSDHKPYVCKYCGKSMARKAMMELHLRVHTGEKPFKCDMCPYATGDHNSLRRHRMRHTGEKPYKCIYCNYSCIQAISYKTHMKNKHPGYSEGVYNCNLCPFRTVNKQSYDYHVQDHQNGKIDTQSMVEKSLKPLPEKSKVQIPRQSVRVQEISAGDLAKISNIEGLSGGDLTAAQLIYSALNAISQQNAHQGAAVSSAGQATSQAQVLPGAQILQNVETSVVSSTTDQGSTHTITFHLPGGATESPILMTLQPAGEEQQEPDAVTVYPVHVE
ncbi:zinc finger protein 813 [Lingula anatina]|uniref:Zinc finger protein 813 n=1 Tax=Lingula anatina TaxID=7574 RepID=A0A1S3IVX7_LINAN|nr:zinc finger protein 813 [Lingula anatina]|eukprot:XP_013402345.1 zinc finger protein 813 [Lingula anatina]